jgi:plastocyanin
VTPTKTICLAIALTLTAVACKDPQSQAPPPVAATPVDAATAGTIAVAVRYSGAVPQPQAINMSSTPGCAQLHQEPVYDRAVAVNGDHLANVIVWIDKGLEGWVLAPPSKPLVFDQKGCVYQPRVGAAMVGQPVEFLNSDSEAHNVHGRPSVVSSWNFMMSRAGSQRTLYFDKPEVGIAIGCDIHPWMKAFLCVVPNPYFGVSDDDGRVVLASVPPGSYTLSSWHETLGRQDRPVTLAPKGEVAVEVAYAAK